MNLPVKISLWRAFKRREAFAVAGEGEMNIRRKTIGVKS